jgi:hypothetical protein
MYVLRLGIRFVYTWRPQLEAIRVFFETEGISAGNIGKEGKGENRPAYRLTVDEVASVKKAIKAMLPFCVKKQEDLRIAIDYLENRITGNEAILRFNEQSKIDRRRSGPRLANLPYTRAQGQRLHELINAKKAQEAHYVVVADTVKSAICKDHAELGWELTRLSRKYGYSQGVIRRVLRRKTQNTT